MAGDNPESSAPLGACRQEGGSLCLKGGGIAKRKVRCQIMSSLCRKRESKPRARLTWDLKRAAGVRAGWRMWKGSVAAAAGRVWEAVPR